MEFDDAYALLLTHETRLEQDQDDKSVINANFAYANAYYPKAYYVQSRGNFKRGGYYSGRNAFFGRGNMNISPRMFNGGFRNGYGRGYSFDNNFPALRNSLLVVKNRSTNMNGSQGTFNNSSGDPICHICLKTSHIVDIC